MTKQINIWNAYYTNMHVEHIWNIFIENILTVLDINSSFSCPKIRQNRPQNLELVAYHTFGKM